MKISEFKAALTANPDLELRFVLPDGDVIEAHAHITEVARVDKTFVDCGGTIRRISTCQLQAWVAEDTEHRLRPSSLASILEKAEAMLGDEDLEMEIEYEDCSITQFPVRAVSVDGPVLIFDLGEKHTDCLAKDVCLPNGARGTGGCC